MPSAFDSVPPSVQSQLDAKADSTSLSTLGGIDSFASLAAFPVSGDAETIYHAQDTGDLHRWTGTSYAVVSGQLAIGDTAGTAGAGDLTKVAHDHSQAAGNPHGTTAADVGAVPSTGGTFTGDVTIGDTSGGNNSKLKIFGDSSSNDFSALEINKRFPLIKVTDTGTGGSPEFGIWFLGNQMRFGSNASTQPRAAMYITTGVGAASIVAVNGQLILNNLPTSPTGLSAGQIWNDGGTLKIV